MLPEKPKDSYFPIRIKTLKDDQELIVTSPEDVPSGESFVVVRITEFSPDELLC